MMAALGAAVPARADSNRVTDNIGVYLGFAGDPLPSTIGINGGFNFQDYLRFTAGAGKMSSGDTSLTTYALGVHGFVPDWDFTPTIGVTFATVVFDQPPPAGQTLGGFFKGDSEIYFSLGLDWQTGLGLYLGAGFNVSPGAAGGSGYADVGWFF